MRPLKVFGLTLDELHDALQYARARGWTPPKPKLPPDGEYRVVCSHIEEKHSVAATFRGRTYWMGTFVILDGDFAGTILYRAFHDTSNTQWPWDAVIDHPKNLTGVICKATVKRETWQNQPRAAIRGLLPEETDA